MKKSIVLPNISQPEMGRVLVKWDPDKRELIVEDNGIGMDLDVIKFHLMCVGSSFYNTSKFQAENLDYTPISRFGIGILTCFMISDDIEIITCKKEGGYRVKMSSVHGSYLLKELEPGNRILEGLEPHGTRVKLQLRHSIDTVEKSILDIIRYWIILPECTVVYAEKGKEEEIIGFNNPSKALEHFMLGEKDSDTELVSIPLDDNGSTYELTFAVSCNTFTPERNFMIREEPDKSVIPAVCVEGIRVDENIPCFSSLSAFPNSEEIIAMLSINGNKKLRTTVSRTSLERDKEYTKVGKICAEIFSNYVQDEVAKISQQKGEPLSQASTAGIRIQRTLIRNVTSKEILDHLDELHAKIPTIVIENTNNEGVIVTSRTLISEEELKKLTAFWAIESRLVDSLGIISRDLGRELSLNDFLGKLAPELLDNRINPILPDAHLFKNLILSSHQLYKVEFSQKNQQTLMRWELKKEIPTKDCYSINLLNQKEISDIFKLLEMRGTQDNISRYDYHMHKRQTLIRICAPLHIVPIEGDIKKVRGIKTRLVTILNPESKITSVIQVLAEVMTKIKTFNITDIYTLIEFSDLTLKIASTHYRKRFDKSYNCNTYSPVSASSSEDYYSNGPKIITDISWREEMIKINRLLDNAGINKRIDFSIEEIINEGEVFDASRYWLDWGTL